MLNNFAYVFGMLLRRFTKAKDGSKYSFNAGIYSALEYSERIVHPKRYLRHSVMFFHDVLSFSALVIVICHSLQFLTIV